MKASALLLYCLFFLLTGPQEGRTYPNEGLLTIVSNQEKLHTIKENNSMKVFVNSTALIGALGLRVQDLMGGLPSKDKIPYCDCDRKCDSGRKRFEIIITKQLSWHDALIYCKERRMELATIRNKEDNNRMLDVIKKAGMENGEKSRMFWIGGTMLHSSRGFFWMSDGDQVSYTNWLHGQPDDYDQSQKCMTYQHGWMSDIRWAWDDNFCSSALSFACEYC